MVFFRDNTIWTSLLRKNKRFNVVTVELTSVTIFIITLQYPGDKA